jgi:hypothetical protein
VYDVVGESQANAWRGGMIVAQGKGEYKQGINPTNKTKQNKIQNL